MEILHKTTITMAGGTVPTTKLENQLRGEGYSLIAGVDEAGRGAWAGPIVAAAVVLPEDSRQKLRGLKDSKLLTEKNREDLYKVITKMAISWSVAQVSSETIDRIGIQPANINAMVNAARSLSPSPDIVLVDGFPIDCEFETRKIIKGDRDVVTIAAASIIAKVTRDRMMKRMDEQFPGYNFMAHKGYGTAAHSEALKKTGVSPLHRKSYKPIAELL